MLTPSLPTESPAGLSAAARRRIQAGMVVRSTDGTPRAGVLPWHTDAIVTGTTDLAMTYQVGQFVAITSRDGIGAERVANDASTTVATTPAPPSNSRIDVIWVQCQFPLAGDSTATTVLGVTQGVPDVSPEPPAIPPGALELATAVVSSTNLTTQSAIITQTYPYTAAPGGVVLLRSLSEQNAWDPVDGSQAYRLDLERFVERIAGGWDQVDGAEVGFFGNGFNPYSASGWTGLRYWVRNRVLYLDGAIRKDASGGFGLGVPFAQLPVGFRPPTKWRGVNCEVLTDGNLVTTTSGAALEAFGVSATFPL